jgi:subtilase family serine protease
MKNKIKYILAVSSLTTLLFPSVMHAAMFSNFKAKPPIHVSKAGLNAPRGFTPEQIKIIYNLPSSGGSGTVAIIGAYQAKNIEHDLAVFSTQFNLPDCTTNNNCLEIHPMSSKIKADAGWSLETSLDVEWVHAIAPQAKILLVEAVSPSGSNLLKAIDFARGRADVVAVSISWGGAEFADEESLESHFISQTGASFFASSGDSGNGVSWPAVSANVIGVGGTTLDASLLPNTTKKNLEKAWSGSGGGVSAYITEPDYQKEYTIPKAKHMRAVPDVSYDADPASGFPVYDSFSYNKQRGWFTLGGTSAGAPQWAAIQALGHTATLSNFYTDKASAATNSFFRDITSGKNGTCAYYCSARKHYDYVTGLGSPLTVKF